MSADECSLSKSPEELTIQQPQTAESTCSTLLQDEMVDFFGPALPPHMQGKKRESGKEQIVYGPVLPKNLGGTSDDDSTDGDDGPKRGDEPSVIGPAVPDHLRNTESEENTTENIGSDDDGDRAADCYGPSPSLMTSDSNAVQYSSMYRNKAPTVPDTETTHKRESWMLELPEKKKGNSSFDVRRFRNRIVTEKEDDRSVWTDTPEDRMNKKKVKNKDYEALLKSKMLEERNKEMEKLVKKASKKHKKKDSLLELHKKKLKKQKKKEEEKRKKEREREREKPERRPFDRNIDLQVRRIDETQKRIILNKAAYLNDRFASGESKFL